MSRSCRPRWRKPPRSRVVARCSSGRLSSPIPSSAFIASAVIAASQPKPAASGKTASRAFWVRRRWPESGSRAAIARGEPDQPARRLLWRSRSRRPASASNAAIVSVAVAAEQRPEVAAKVGVAEQELARRSLALAQRERLALAAPREPDDSRSGSRRNVRRCVLRAVVGDDHLRAGELLPDLGHSRPDPRLLVARCDQDRQGLTHSGRAAARSAAGFRSSRCRERRSSPDPRRRGGAPSPAGRARMSIPSTVERP